MKIFAIEGQINTVYVVVYDDDCALLLDSGCAADVEKVQEFLKLKGLRASVAVASHAHPDHFGGSFLWKKLGTKVIAPARINVWYQGVFGWLQYRVDMGLTRYVHESSRKKNASIPRTLFEMAFPGPAYYFPRELEIDSVIPIADALASEDDLSKQFDLDPKFRDWKAIAVPGHTTHMMALWHPESQTLYAADTLVHITGKHGGFQPPLALDFPELHVATLQRLSVLPVKTLLLAHGGPFAVSGHDRIATVSRNMHVGVIHDYAALLAGLISQVSKKAVRGHSPFKGIVGLLYGLTTIPSRMCSDHRRIQRALARRVATAN